MPWWASLLLIMVSLLHIQAYRIIRRLDDIGYDTEDTRYAVSHMQSRVDRLFYWAFSGHLDVSGDELKSLNLNGYVRRWW